MKNALEMLLLLSQQSYVRVWFTNSLRWCKCSLNVDMIGRRSPVIRAAPNNDFFMDSFVDYFSIICLIYRLLFQLISLFFVLID